MTLLERFSTIRATIGLDDSSNSYDAPSMIDTLRASRELLGIAKWSDERSLPSQLCDVEDVLGLPPPIETIATLPPGSARARNPATHRTYTNVIGRSTGSSTAAISEAAEGGASALPAIDLTLAAEEQQKKLAEDEEEEGEGNAVEGQPEE
jgi:hypothetical protein